jgi:hypothetical protein
MSRWNTKRRGVCVVSALVASLALSFPGAAQAPDADLAATMQRLSIKLPPQVTDSDAVKRRSKSSAASAAIKVPLATWGPRWRRQATGERRRLRR